MVTEVDRCRHLYWLTLYHKPCNYVKIDIHKGKHAQGVPKVEFGLPMLYVDSLVDVAKNHNTYCGAVLEQLKKKIHIKLYELNQLVNSDSRIQKNIVTVYTIPTATEKFIYFRKQCVL